MSALPGFGSSGDGGNNPNDHERERFHRETLDNLRRREEGKINFCLQKLIIQKTVTDLNRREEGKIILFEFCFWRQRFYNFEREF